MNLKHQGYKDLFNTPLTGPNFRPFFSMIRLKKKIKLNLKLLTMAVWNAIGATVTGLIGEGS